MAFPMTVVDSAVLFSPRGEAMLDSRELANRGSNARAYIEANYGWSRTARQVCVDL